MRAFLRTISLAGFTALWLSHLCSLVCATSNITTPKSGHTTPSPPYSLQDPTVHPGSPGGYGPLAPSDTRRNVTVEPPLHALATHRNFAIGPGNRQVFHRHSGVSRVQKTRERVTPEKKLISKYRRLHGIKRTCNHKRWKKPCFCGVPPDELDKMFQSLFPKPTGGLANITGTGGSTSGSVNTQVFRSDPDDFLPALSSSSSGFLPWLNSSQPILAEVMAANKPPFTSEPSAASRETQQPTAEDTSEYPETRPITQEQLIGEVRGIYAGLVMIENKCIENDERICRNPKSLSEEQWQATTVLHRTLLSEKHDFFLASQHRYYPPEFFQGQFVHGDEQMLDMAPSPDSGGSKFDYLQFLVPEGSCARVEKTLGKPAVPGISANNFDALPSATRYYFSEGSSTNSAINESVLFRGIGDNFLGDTTEDTEMPYINFDDFLLPETPEPPSINPLNSLFNPGMTFSMQVDEPDTDVLLEEHYVAQESDWNFEFDVHMVHAIVEHVPGIGLSQKSPVTVKQNAYDSVQAAEECAHDLCNSEERDDQATSKSDAVEDKYDTDYPLQIDDKPIQNFSTAPDHDFGSLPTQPSFHQANAVNTAILGRNRMRAEVVFCLLLVQSQRGSPNTLATSQKSSSFLAVEIVLLLLAICYSISSSS